MHSKFHNQKGKNYIYFNFATISDQRKCKWFRPVGKLFRGKF